MWSAHTKVVIREPKQPREQFGQVGQLLLVIETRQSVSWPGLISSDQWLTGLPCLLHTVIDDNTLPH
jgi:hypothetical protein